MSENVLDKLTRNQKRAIAALLEHKSEKAAAKAIGMSDKTIRRYMTNPIFRLAIARAESDRIEEAGRRLLANNQQALDVLWELMSNAIGENNRRLAAVAWLDFSLRWRELRIEERLAKLEEAIIDEEKD